MLTRILSYLLITFLNAASGIMTMSRRKRSALVAEPSHDNRFPIGKRIADVSDVSVRPSLGETVELRFADLLMHLYAIGRTGIGKTSLLTVLVDAFVKHNKSFVIIDARGDLIARLVTRLAGVGAAAYWRDRLTIVDLPSDWSAPLNVFAMGGDPYGTASAIFDSLEERVAGGFGVQVSECLRSCLVTLALGRGRWTLLHIEPLLSNFAFRQAVLSGCDDPLILGFWARYNGLSTEQQAVWTGSVLNKVNPLLMAVPQMRRSIGQHGCLPFRSLIDKPGQVIFINLGISELHGPAQVFGSMVATGIIRAAMSRLLDTPEGKRHPVFMLCDEFENYSNPLFHEGLQEGRRAGLGLALLHQNLSQIKPATSDLIMNNAKTMFLFGCGARDASQLSREIGGDEAWDARTILTRQSVGQAYLLRRGEEPLRVQVEYVPDPKIDTAVVASVREAGLKAYCRQSAEVDAEIAADLAAARTQQDVNESTCDAESENVVAKVLERPSNQKHPATIDVRPAQVRPASRPAGRGRGRKDR